MDVPDNDAAPNQIRIRAVFVPDGELVTPELLEGMRGTVRIPVELVVETDAGKAEGADS